MMYSWFERIPSVWIALIIGAFGAWMYLRYTMNLDQVAVVVMQPIFSVVIVFVFSTKFSNLILFPSVNFKNDIYSIISGVPTNGWVVGLALSVIFLLYRLKKDNVLGLRALRILAESVLCGSIVFFLYLAIADFNPYRLQDIVRTLLFAIFLFGTHRIRLLSKAQPQYLWGLIGTLLFTTSVIVPQIEVNLIFSLSQWVYITLIAVCLIADALMDIRKVRAK